MSRPPEIEPVIVKQDSVMGDTYTHPAFGAITASKPTGNIGVLHGSDLRHHSCITLTIHSAVVHRSLNRDWHSPGAILVEVDLSEHQWAHFVASAGDGTGTPCTFRLKPAEGYELERVPYIARAESKTETFRGEMETLMRERMQAAANEVAKLGTLIESGKAGKTDLKAIHAALSWAVTGLPGSVGFVMEQFSENMEAVTQAAKTEVEAFVNNVATRTGIEALRNGAAPVMLERKE